MHPGPWMPRHSVYKFVQQFGFAPLLACWPPTGSLALLISRTAGEWLSLGASPLVGVLSGPRAELGVDGGHLGGHRKCSVGTCLVPGF